MKVSEFVKISPAILLRENYGAVFARIHPFRYVGDPAVVSDDFDFDLGILGNFNSSIHIVITLIS